LGFFGLKLHADEADGSKEYKMLGSLVSVSKPLIIAVITVEPAGKASLV